MKKFIAEDLLREGGNWLGETHKWIQWNCVNGDTVTWGSNEYLHPKVLTVCDIEAFAAKIAAVTLNELIDAFKILGVE